MSRRSLRLFVVPALLFLAVSGLVLGLALEPPAQSEPAAVVEGGDPVRGEALFADRCAGCHGEAGRNASVGPDLAGNPISPEEAQAQIETGSGAMPANLVEGTELEDTLAYLETILAGDPTRGDD
jgi:mono/diheme cytochrome c family protein